MASGGGSLGWFVSKKDGVRIESDGDKNINFRNSSGLKVKSRPSSNNRKPPGIIDKLDHTALVSYRWKSEGVGEDLLFIEGWDGAGKHNIVKSEDHSQQDKNLWGGKRIGDGVSWYGPRKMSGDIDEINKLKAKTSAISTSKTWDQIRKSGSFLQREDWVGISNYWKNRSQELEQEVLELYKPLWWWKERMGNNSSKQRVDLELELEGLGKILDKTEDQLKRDKWDYGQLIDNGKLRIVRKVGNVEGVAFNYLKLLFWPEMQKTLKLKEKNIAKIVLGLMTGEEYGFDCASTDKNNIKNKFFPECNKDGTLGGPKVKRVMKSVVEDIGKNVPIKGKGPSWRAQESADSWNEWPKMIDMDSITTSGLINEKCETGSSFGWALLQLDLEKDIRKEVCDLIIRPWFGDIVSDKRLCLIEIPDYQYYLRMNHYFKVMDWITWHNKGAFWTKCSNYGI